MRRFLLVASALVMALCLSLPHATPAYAHNGGGDDDHSGYSSGGDRDGHGGNDDRDGHGGYGDDRGGNDNHGGNSYRGREKKTVHIGDRDRDNDSHDSRNHGPRITVVKTYKLDSRTPFTQTVCGVVFTGFEVTYQEYQLLSNGLLNFKFTSNIDAYGTDSRGKRVKLSVDNFEIDHILQDTPPDLAPYGGDLAAWVEDNIDVVVEISSGFKMTVDGDRNGPKLLNNWVFEADLHGINVNKVTFKASGGC